MGYLKSSCTRGAMNISIILDLVLSVQLSKSAVECIKQFFSPSSQHPILIAVDGNNPVFPLDELNSSLVVINEHYNVHFEFTLLRVNYAVVFLGCPSTNSTIFKTIKRNRLISVKMKLLLVADGRCRSFSASEVYLKDIARILGPACSAVIVYDGVEEDFHWAWSHGLKNQTSKSGSIDPNQCKIGIPDVKEFKGRELKVSTTPLAPYVMNPNSEGQFEEGLEIEIIRNIAHAMGMELKWIPLPANEPARLLTNAKKEYIGMMGMLDRLESDVAFGGTVYHLGRSLAAEMVKSHTEDTLLWLIPSAPEANNLAAICGVFSLTMWLLVALSVLLCTFVFSLGDNLKSFPSNLLQTFGILLDQGVPLKSYMHVYFWLLYVLYCVIVTNAYRSSLITALTSKKQASWFETPEEAVAAGETTFLSPSGMPLYQSTAVYDPMWRTILQTGRYQGITDFALLKNISEKRHGLVLCVLNPCKFSIYENNLIGRDLKPKVIFMEKRFQLFATSMFMAPGSVLQPGVDTRTLWLNEAGLVDHWLKEMERRAQLRLPSDDGNYADDGPQKLSIMHLESAFFIFVSFLFLSFLVFLLECLIFHKHLFHKTWK